MAERYPVVGNYPILEFFTYEHLPPQLAAVSKQFCQLARELAAGETLAPQEVAAGLRHLLEAKDCFVRAEAATVDLREVR